MSDDRLREVRFGTSQEDGVITEWLRRTDRVGLVPVPTVTQFADFDRTLCCGRTGVTLAYLEVKVRRVALSQYGDALFPERKHAFALEQWEKHKIPTLAIVMYSSGEIVELLLHKVPAKRQMVKRYDRATAVPHVLYDKAQFSRIIPLGPPVDTSAWKDAA